MKKIESVSIWNDGQLKSATLLDVVVNSIVLGSSANITFRLYSAMENEPEYPNAQLSSGNLLLDGEDYSNWGSDDDYVWIWVATKLNLQIIQ